MVSVVSGINFMLSCPQHQNTECNWQCLISFVDYTVYAKKFPEAYCEISRFKFSKRINITKTQSIASLMKQVVE